MTRMLGLAGATMILLAPLAAHADAANDPCMGLKGGDACTTLDNKPGTCQPMGDLLECVENTTSGNGGAGGTGGNGSGGSGNSGATSAGGNGTGATGPGATSGGGTETSGGGETDEDSGCSMSQSKNARSSALAGLAALAVGALVARRRRNRA